MREIETPGLRAARAWARLDGAFAAFNAHLRAEHGLTGAQLAMLRIVAGTGPAGSGAVTLAGLRERLVMHPATLGQLVDRLAAKGLVSLGRDPADARRRLVTVTPAGAELLERAPLAGPVRLRSVPVDPDRAERLADALDDAIDLFGLRAWTGRGGDT
jgi:DNA-binding MarR family transcriptional regulator